jgi:predicted O-linked N-acetylglucosamine transferase (SPINDLY family)
LVALSALSATRLVKSLLPRPLLLSHKLATAPREKRVLRVGWVSSNIGDHSLSHLMRSVFGMHGMLLIRCD